jgi:hypothetical protein
MDGHPSLEQKRSHTRENTQVLLMLQATLTAVHFITFKLQNTFPFPSSCGSCIA